MFLKFCRRKFCYQHSWPSAKLFSLYSISTLDSSGFRFGKVHLGIVYFIMGKQSRLTQTKLILLVPNHRNKGENL